MAMNRERYARLHSLFATALELGEDERASFLAKECEHDADLAAEVRALLALDGSSQQFLDPMGDADDEAVKSRDPQRIGEFTVVRRIGGGGMGVVYEGRQQNPERTVALKVLRRDTVTKDNLRRFRQEATVLATLQHRGIAQVYAAGTFESDDGSRPFFAMEFIAGCSLTEYAEREQLDSNQRLELIALVCDAVAHAHERGFIHRDLKPDNILVDGEGQPKVLDFGIAKAVGDAPAMAMTQFTHAGMLVGTPAYMSPEQLDGVPDSAGVRSDVYALGVICYQLLAGQLPHDLTNKSISESARIVIEHDAKILGEVDATLRGDVEIIVAKALERDQTRRYASAVALSEDIRRYLHDEPVLARRPSAFYQLSKFTKRNKGLVAAAVASMLILIAGAITATVFAIGEATQRYAASQLSYRSLLSAASVALDTGRPSLARSQIEEAPEAFRSWEWHYLDARAVQRRTIDVGQPLIGTLAFTSGGHRVLVTMADGSIAVLEFATGKIATSLRIEGAKITSVSAQVTGSRIAAGCDDGRVLVWDSWHASAPTVVDQHEDAVRRVAWSANGTTLASAGTRQLRLWSAEGSRVLDELPAGVVCNELCVSPAGDRVCACFNGSIGVRLWHIAAGSHRDYFNSFKPLCAAFRPDGSQLAIGHQWQPIHIVDGHTLELLHVPGGHNRAVTGVAWSPDGTQLLSTSTDPSAQLWSTQPWESITLVRHETNCAAPVVSPDGKYGLYLQPGTALISVWSLVDQPSTGIQAHAHSVANVVWSNANSVVGPLLASRAYAEPAVKLWALDTGELVASLELEGSAQRQYPPEMAFSADGRELSVNWARHEAGGVVAVFDLATGVGREEPYTGALPERFYGKTTHQLRRLSPRRVRAADGFAVIPADRTCYVWRAPKQKPIATWVYPGEVLAVAVSPDDRQVIISDDTGRIRVRDTRTFEETMSLNSHPDNASSIAWSVDGSRIVTGSGSGMIRAFDAVTGALRFEMAAHKRAVYSLSFSPDGTQLASGGHGGIVQVWDTVPRSQRALVAFEARRLRETARPWVRTLRTELGAPAKVRDRIVAETTRDPHRRRAALRVLLEEVSRR